MSPIARTGERNEVYIGEAPHTLGWRHFEENGLEITRGSELLSAEHPERLVFRAVEAYPASPTWFEERQGVWVLLSPADVAHHVAQHLNAGQRDDTRRDLL